MIVFKIGFLLAFSTASKQKNEKKSHGKKSDKKSQKKKKGGKSSSKSDRSPKRSASSKLGSMSLKSKSGSSISGLRIRKRNIKEPVQLPRYVLDVGKPVGYAHIEFQLGPEYCKQQIDVVYWKNVVRVSYLSDVIYILKNNKQKVRQFK